MLQLPPKTTRTDVNKARNKLKGVLSAFPELDMGHLLLLAQIAEEPVFTWENSKFGHFRCEVFNDGVTSARFRVDEHSR
jgi:hypothetical protein